MKPQRILFGLLTPGLGGHTRTAVALAEVLRDRGHAIDFLVRASTDDGTDSSVTASLIRAAHFPVVPIGGLFAPIGQPSFRRNLRDLVRREPYDVLHWFEEGYARVRDAAAVAALERRGFVWTITSGGAPWGYYGLNRVVVFTPEVAADAKRRSPQTAVHLLPARLDFRPFDRAFIQSARRDIRNRFAIGDDELLIVRVARCASVYVRSVRAGIALAARLSHAGRPARFLHAGYVEIPEVAQEIRQMVDEANAAAGRRFAHSVTDNVEQGTRYEAAADICIAAGRSAIEALALGQPTLVVWGARYLGMVNEDNIQTMSETNFQGRNTERVVSDEDVVTEMHDAVRTRLAAPAQGARTQELCARFIRDHYSVESAAATYEELYADRTVTVDGFLTHYSNPRHLGRELFHRLPPSIRFSRPLSVLRRSGLWPGLPPTD